MAPTTKPTIGVTGATGFVGRHLVNRLIKDGYKIKAYVFDDGNNLPSQVEVVKGNLLTGRNLEDFLDRVDVVIHLAARLLPPDEDMFRDNVIATHNLFERAKSFSIRQVVYMSTAAVYGNWKKMAYQESDFCKPDTVYGLTKYLGEEILHFWERTSNVKTTILRPFNIYGPGNFKGVIYSFYRSIEKNGTVTIYGTGEQKRDFLYIDDAIEAIVKSVDRRKYGTFNIASGRTYSLKEVVAILEKIIGKKIKVVYREEEQGKPNTVTQSLSKAKSILGWRAKIELETGLRKTILRYEKNF